MAGLEDLLFLGAIGAAAYGVYQKVGGKVSQPVQQNGKIIKRTYTKPKAGYSLSLENTPIAIGDVYGEIRPYDVDNLLDRVPVPKNNIDQYSNYPLLLEARIQEQQAVLTPPSGGAKRITLPDEAQNLIAAGKVSELRGRYISYNFKWGEVFKNRTDSVVKGLLNPSNNYKKMAGITILNNAFKQAQKLETVRTSWGKPLVITNWYRDPASNRAVGGAGDSRHQYGDATDFQFSGASEAAKFYGKYDPILNTEGLGRYGGNRVNISHVDTRGYKSRWFDP